MGHDTPAYGCWGLTEELIEPTGRLSRAMLGLAESVIFPMAELQPLSRKAMRWHSLTEQTARMYRPDLLSCGIAPVGKSPLTTTAIEPDVIRVCSVSSVPERERTADDHSRSDHWEPCHHRHIEQTTSLGLTCKQHQCRQGVPPLGRRSHGTLLTGKQATRGARSSQRTHFVPPHVIMKTAQGLDSWPQVLAG